MLQESQVRSAEAVGAETMYSPGWQSVTELQLAAFTPTEKSMPAEQASQVRSAVVLASAITNSPG